MINLKNTFNYYTNLLIGSIGINQLSDITTQNIPIADIKEIVAMITQVILALLAFKKIKKERQQTKTQAAKISKDRGGSK